MVSESGFCNWPPNSSYADIPHEWALCLFIMAELCAKLGPLEFVQNVRAYATWANNCLDLNTFNRYCIKYQERCFINEVYSYFLHNHKWMK